MKKVLTYEELDIYYKIGLKFEYKKLSKASIRRCYFNWLKNDNDTRQWDEVFQERLNHHEKYIIGAYQELKDSFKPDLLGHVLFDKSTLIFKNLYHQELKITKPKASKAWIRQKLRQYCDENCCTISFDDLYETNISNIYTKLFL